MAPDLATHHGLRLLTGDLTDAAFTASLAGPYAAVFHLAATVDYFGGAALYAHNLAATRNLLEACRRWPAARLVYTSTMGAVDRSRWDRARQPLTEASPQYPTSHYGRAKADEEAQVRASGLPWTIVRLPWCYGPGMADSHHVRNLLQRVRRGAAATRVAWPGRVSVVAAPEAARALAALAGNPRTVRETCYLAEDEPVALGELFAELGRSVGEVRAGAWRLPRWAWALVRAGLPLAPFQLRCLVSDALVVSTAHARSLGVTVAPRGPGWLRPLARYDALQRWPSRRTAPALVTGAAGGIGGWLAWQLYGRGYPLILADRDAAGLAALQRATGAAVWTVDLSDPALAEDLPRTFPARLPWPALVINNAGVGTRGPSWAAAPADCRRVLAVNAQAPALLANFFLGQAPAPVTVVNVASTAAFQPLPLMAAYAAAKAFLLSFSLALEAELRAAGRADRVLTIVPGGTRTGFQAAAGVRTNPREKLLEPDAVAAAIVRALGRRPTLVFIGGRARAMRLAAAVLPLRWQARLFGALMNRLR